MFGVLSVPGSSLHTRGTHDRAPRARQHARFIPAYAGNAWSRLPCGPGRSVHPRIRGERNPFSGAAAPARGSSPYTRGTPKRRRRVRTCPTVHPRIRGERAVVGRLGGGLSRLIPAYAGNAAPTALRVSGASVHPRIRGERVVYQNKLWDINGSSPHTRGTLYHTVLRYAGTRFIPAYAGNAVLHVPRHPCTAVHPRIRGERSIGRPSRALLDGSSPHTRGTP